MLGLHLLVRPKAAAHDICSRLQDVRFKGNGLEAVEVQDNGGGINPQDYETIGTVNTLLC